MATDAQARLTLIDQAEAARAFAACADLDPAGQATPDSAARAGACFRIDAPGGSVVYSLGLQPAARRAWCYGAAGDGSGLIEYVLEAIEAQARALHCEAVGFQTMRRGLVRRALRRGYQLAPLGRGFILEKHLCSASAH